MGHRTGKLLLIGLGWFLAGMAAPLQAFVHISADKPRLAGSAAAPEVVFVWDGAAPAIEDKEDFMDGVWADLDDASLMQVLLTLAMGKWNEVEGSWLVLQLQVENGQQADSRDGIHALVLAEDVSLSVAAFASPVYRSDKPEAEQTAAEKDTGIIHDCDITVSSRSVSAKSLFSTLIHELGHCIGLGHPHANWNSIMSYGRPSGSAHLGLDDMAGLIYLYSTDDEPPRELVACGTTGSKQTGVWPGLLLLVPVFFGCRRRQKPC